MSALAAEWIDDAARLADVAEEWFALWQRQAQPLPFTRPGWLMPWWRHFHPGDLATLALWRGGGLVGLAPLWREDGAHGRRLLPLGISLSDYLDILVAPDGAAEVLQAMAAAIAGRADVDVVSFEDAPPGATVFGLSPPPPWRAERAPRMRCPLLEAADLAAAVPPGRRRKVRMAWHRARRGGLTVRRTAGMDEHRAAVDALIRLHATRWQGRDQGSRLLEDARVAAFFRDAVPAEAEAGIAVLHCVSRPDVAVAVQLGFRIGRDAYAYMSGFDPAFAYESPGTLLIDTALREASDAGCRRFHFLRGAEDYKYAWGATDTLTETFAWRRESMR